MEKIRVIHWGLGAMGSGMARLVAEKEGMEIIGAIDMDPKKVGRDLGEVLGKPKMNIVVRDNVEMVLGAHHAEVVIIATSSFTKEVYPQIEQAVIHGMNVITIAEEMSFPAAQEPELAAKIDALAKKHKVTVLGTGINPGFVLDTLIIALTGVCLNVKKIRAARINDLSPFGPTVMRTQGVGTTPAEFAKGVADGSIVGHIGFPESMSMIAAALGWKLERIEQTREPIISKIHRETPHVVVEPGMVAGCKHIAHGYINGEEVITLEHPQQIHPHLEGVDTGDYIWIEGEPNIALSIKPEIPGGKGTQAIAINMIPQVLSAAPGLKSMKDLPVPAAVMGDIRQIMQG